MSWIDLILLHVETDLIRYFLEDLLCEVSFLHAVLESNELNDISGAFPAVIVCQNLFI